MKAKSSAHYQREYRRRLREQGLVKKEVWILPTNAKLLGSLEKQLRTSPPFIQSKGAIDMTNNSEHWSTSGLLNALQQSDLFTNGQATAELIDGIEPALHIVMGNYGDLPI
ncbi:MAG: DUF2170 family protein, partial [Pseudomonadota bacterium]|nr:DUF2170 family protein [Pseudomonadota bacterium]